MYLKRLIIFDISMDYVNIIIKFDQKSTSDIPNPKYTEGVIFQNKTQPIEVKTSHCAQMKVVAIEQ
jgi:hypothetical protein